MYKTLLWELKLLWFFWLRETKKTQANLLNKKQKQIPHLVDVSFIHVTNNYDTWYIMNARHVGRTSLRSYLTASMEATREACMAMMENTVQLDVNWIKKLLCGLEQGIENNTTTESIYISFSLVQSHITLFLKRKNRNHGHPRSQVAAVVVIFIMTTQSPQRQHSGHYNHLPASVPINLSSPSPNTAINIVTLKPHIVAKTTMKISSHQNVVNPI